MEITAAAIQDHLPYYLTQEARTGILRELRSFPDGMNDDLQPGYQDELLQGDGWRQLQLRNFLTGLKHLFYGVMLSNTCDVSPENKRDLPANIVFAPLIALATYETVLARSGVSAGSIRLNNRRGKKNSVSPACFICPREPDWRPTTLFCWTTSIRCPQAPSRQKARQRFSR